MFTNNLYKMLAKKIIQVVFTKIYSRVCLRDNLLTWATVSLIIVFVVSLDFPVAQKRKRIKMTLKIIWKIGFNVLFKTGSSYNSVSLHSLVTY